MMILYSWGTKVKKSTYLGLCPCANCDGYTHYYLFRQVRYFSIFYIPIIQFTKSYFIGCSSCMLGTQIDKTAAKEYKERYARFPTQHHLERVFEMIQTWSAKKEGKEEKAQLLQEIGKICNFSGHEEYLENLIAEIDQDRQEEVACIEES